MGKALIIKGADFSQVAVDNSTDITQNVVNAGKWFPQRTILSLYASEPAPSPDRSCVCLFDITTIDNYEDYTKVRLTVKDGFDYVFAIGDDSEIVSPEHWQRITGQGTHDSTFAWVTDNQLATGDIKRYININVRYDDNATLFPSNAKIENYIKIELITG